MLKRHNYDNCCSEKRKRCYSCCYPSYIDNQVIVRGLTGPAGVQGPMGPQGITDPAGPAGGVLNFPDCSNIVLYPLNRILYLE